MTGIQNDPLEKTLTYATAAKRLHVRSIHSQFQIKGKRRRIVQTFLLHLRLFIGKVIRSIFLLIYEFEYFNNKKKFREGLLQMKIVEVVNIQNRILVEFGKMQKFV